MAIIILIMLIIVILFSIGIDDINGNIIVYNVGDFDNCSSRSNKNMVCNHERKKILLP